MTKNNSFTPNHSGEGEVLRLPPLSAIYHPPLPYTYIGSPEEIEAQLKKHWEGWK